jgi:hypothetical protein
MDVTFATAELAALCNSEQRLTKRWGPEAGRLVARRLLDLAAVHAPAVGRLPGASIRMGEEDEAAVITFGGDIVIRGVITAAREGPTGTRGSAERIVITSVDVHESVRR